MVPVGQLTPAHEGKMPWVGPKKSKSDTTQRHLVHPTPPVLLNKNTSRSQAPPNVPSSKITLRSQTAPRAATGNGTGGGMQDSGLDEGKVGMTTVQEPGGGLGDS